MKTYRLLSRLTLIVFCLLELGACSHASPKLASAINEPTPKKRSTAQAHEVDLQASLSKLKLPPGFSISLYAVAPGARSMALSPNGTLFVGTGGMGGDYQRVYAIRDLDGDGKADEIKIIADGLNVPNGVAFKDGDLYVAELSRILRYKNIESKLANPGKPEVFYAGLPNDEYHGWKFIRFAPDGSLIVPQGAPCNVCEVDENHAGIFKISADGKNKSTIALGVRNSVGFDFDPITHDMVFTDNGRDMLGEDIPPCELNKLPAKNWQESQPLHYGFPFCHGKNISDPEFGKNKNCDDYKKTVMDFPAHVAPLGMRFYTGKMFPQQYKNQIFVAEHGSWNRTIPQGYRVINAWTNDGGKTYEYKVFAEGWLNKDGTRWGRPVDVEIMKDGSLLVSDDEHGAIYRITAKK